PQCYWKSFGISPSNMVHQLDTQWSNWQNSLTGSNTAAIKPIAPIAQGWSPSSTNILTGAEIAEFVNRLKTNSNSASIGGYKGVSFWRADLHTPNMWSGISGSSIGNPTGAPLILTQPESQTVNAGDSATFSVEAIGSGILGYQWRRNGLSISGATTSSHTRTNIQSLDVGVYSVIVSNAAGAVISSDALLSMQSHSPWIETFETGLGNWTTISSALTNSSTQNHTPSGTNAAKVGSSNNRMYRNLGAEVDGYSKVTFWIYDSTQTRAFGEVRAYSGAGYGQGSLQQILAIGRYSVGFGTGTGDLASEVVDTTKYQGRVYAGSNAGWFNLNNSGVPARSTGWHKFEIERMANGTTINFYVDGILGRSITSATAAKWDAVTIGSAAAGTTAGDAWFDDINAEYFGVPVITTQPVSKTVNAGATVNFTVTAINNVTSYQWRKDGINISGATSSSLVSQNVTGSNSGEYTVVVANGVGSVISTVAILTVIDPPVFVTAPANQVANPGSEVTFHAVVSGTPPFTYLWKKNGVTLTDDGNIAGSDSDHLILSNVTEDDAAEYTVIVSNLAGSISAKAILSINAGLIFFEDFEAGNLSNWTTVSGGTALTISSTQNNPVSGSKTAQQTNSLDKMYHDLGVEVQGSARATFWIYDAGTNDQERAFGEVRAFSGNGFGQGSLQQILAIGNYLTPFDANTGTLENEQLQTAYYQGRVFAGQNTGWFNLNTAGASYRSIGWHKFHLEKSTDGSTVKFYVDGKLGRTITGVNNATWDTVAMGSYGAGVGDSEVGWFDDIKIEYLDGPTIITHPVSQVQNAGANATFVVVATGNLLSYQWYKDGIALDGAIASSLDLNNVQVSDAADYTVLVTNERGSQLSNPANLWVGDSPSILVQPVSQSVNAGVTVTFSVGADGGLPLSFAWKKNGVNLVDDNGVSGSSTSTLTITGVTVTDEAGYTVTISNASGEVTSESATLAVARLNSTITFATISGKVYGNPAFGLSAVSSAGLPVIFDIVSGLATVTNNVLTITGAGFTTVRASTAETVVYAAQAEDQTFEATKANQSITFTAVSNQILGSSDLIVPLKSSASSGLPITFALIFAPDGTTIVGTNAVINNTGSVWVRASQAGNDNFNAAADMDRLFQVTSSSKLTQAITFTEPFTSTYGASFTPIASATSTEGPVNFFVISGPGVVADNVVTSTGVGTVKVRGFHSGDAVYNPATTDQSYTISKASQTIAFDTPIPDKVYGDTFEVSATASSGLPVTFVVTSIKPGATTVKNATVSGNQITVTGMGTVTVEARQNGNSLYLSASPVSQSFDVSKKPLTVIGNDFIRAYGTPNAIFTARYEGFVNGDGPATISGSPIFSTDATTGSDVGNYEIRVTKPTDDSALTSKTYSFQEENFTNGNLTILKATLTAKAKNRVRAAGAANPAFTGIINGFARENAMHRGEFGVGIEGINDNNPAIYVSSAPETGGSGYYLIERGSTISLNDPIHRIITADQKTNYSVSYFDGALAVGDSRPFAFTRGQVIFPLLEGVSTYPSVYVAPDVELTAFNYNDGTLKVEIVDAMGDPLYYPEDRLSIENTTKTTVFNDDKVFTGNNAIHIGSVQGTYDGQGTALVIAFDTNLSNITSNSIEDVVERLTYNHLSPQFLQNGRRINVSWTAGTSNHLLFSKELQVLSPNCPDAIDLVVAIDFSNSASGYGAPSRKCSADFAAKFATQDRLSAIFFEGQAAVAKELTGDLEAVRNALLQTNIFLHQYTRVAGLTEGGYSCADNALSAAIAQFELNSEITVTNRQRVVVLMSDGAWKPTPSTREIINQAKETGIKIIIIGFGTNNEQLLRMAATSPLDAYFASGSTQSAKIDSLRLVFEKIVNKLCRGGVAPEMQFAATSTYIENQASKFLDPASTLTDADSPNFAGGTLTASITQNSQAADRLGMSANNEITMAGNVVNYQGVPVGTLSAVGNHSLQVIFDSECSLAAAQAVLRSVSFHNLSENPSSNPRTVAISLSDGSGGSTSVTTTVHVVPVNDAPTLYIGDVPTVYAGGPSQVVSLSGITGGPENETGWPLSVQVSISPEDEDAFAIGGTPQIIYSPSATTGSISFTPGATERNVTVTVTVRDQDGTANGGIDESSSTFVIEILTLDEFSVQASLAEGQSLNPTVEVLPLAVNLFATHSNGIGEVEFKWSTTKSPGDVSVSFSPSDESPNVSAILTAPGEYKFRATGTDDLGQSKFGEVTITVTKARTYTTNIDFDQGTLMNLNYEVTTNQLQINYLATPFPFVNTRLWRSNGHIGESVLARIDVNTGECVGEYSVAPGHPDLRWEGMAHDYVELGMTVDKYGNSFVGISGFQLRASGICKIGVVIGGTRGHKNPDGSFTADLNGDYLKPPFLYNTCIDRDRDGYIKTSRGSGHLLPWKRKTADGPIDVTEAEDEAILDWFPVLPYSGAWAGFSVTVDPGDNLWLGISGLTNELRVINGNTGIQVTNVTPCERIRQEAGLNFLNRNRSFWTLTEAPASALMISGFDGDTLLANCIEKLEFEQGTAAMDPRTGNVWSMYDRDGLVYLSKISETGVIAETQGMSVPITFYSSRMRIDAEGNVWLIAWDTNSDARKLFRFVIENNDSNTSYVGRVPLPCDFWPVELSIDSNGKVWLMTQASSGYGYGDLLRIDPTKGPRMINELVLEPTHSLYTNASHVGEVDMSVILYGGQHAAYYLGNFNMTGTVALESSPGMGVWSVVHDDGVHGTEWSKVRWNNESGAVDEGIVVKARTAETITGLSTNLFNLVSNGQQPLDHFTGEPLSGRYIELQVTLRRSGSVIYPILTDITVEANNTYAAGTFPGALAEAKPPALVDDSFPEAGQASIQRNSTGVVLDVLKNDENDPSLTIRNVSQPQNGWVVISESRTNLQYSPRPFFLGTDSFTYMAANSAGGIARARVKVEVSRTGGVTLAVNDTNAVPVIMTASGIQRVILDVLANDMNAGLKPLRVTHVRTAGDWVSLEETPGGSVAASLGYVSWGVDFTNQFCPPLRLEYMTDASAVGQDEFEYKMVDEYGSNSSAHVTLNLYNPCFDGPLVAQDKVVSVPASTLGPIVITNTIWIQVVPSDDCRGTTVTNVTPALHGGEVDHSYSHHVKYTSPASGFTGIDEFTYSIVDNQGNTASGKVTVFVVPSDNNAPIISLPDSIEVKRNSRTNEMFDLLLNASDDPGDLLEIFSFTQPLHGQVVEKNGKLLYSPDSGYTGPDLFTCWVADYTNNANGQVVHKGGLTEATNNIVVASGSGVVPIAKIINPPQANYSAGGIAANYPRISEGVLIVTGNAHSSVAGESVTYDLVISTIQGEEVLWYSGGAGVTNDTLGTFDLSRLRNGVYDLWLFVEGENEYAEDSVRFILESDLKVGQFTFSEQDAVIPARGMPLTVIRTYDSLNPNKGDFGYSWSFAINSMDVELDEFRETVLDITEDDPAEKYFNMRVGGGRNVTLTLPDGRRSTFLFTLVRAPGDEFGFGYVPRYISPPGVNATLEVLNSAEAVVLPTLNVILGGIYPPYWQEGDPRLPVESFDFPGFKLTTEDGIGYYLTRDDQGLHTVVQGSEENYSQFPTFPVRTWGPPKLTRIEHPDGNVTHIAPDKIWEADSSGNPTRTIVFDRDNYGRIKSVFDPASLDGDGDINGPALIKYDYDFSGRLTHVHKLVNRVSENYLTNQYFYTNTAYPNFITGIKDPRGKFVTRNTYQDGRLSSVTDASGNTTTYVHDIANNQEIITDPLMRRIVHSYDNEGRITKTTGYKVEVDGESETLHWLNETRRSYTTLSEQKQRIETVTTMLEEGVDTVEGLTTTTVFTYFDNNFSQLSSVQVTSPTGRTTTSRFDQYGNPTETISPSGAVEINTYHPLVETGDRSFSLKPTAVKVRDTVSLIRPITSATTSGGTTTETSGVKMPEYNLVFGTSETGTDFNGVTIEIEDDPAITTEDNVASVSYDSATKTITVKINDGYTTIAKLVEVLNAAAAQSGSLIKFTASDTVTISSWEYQSGANGTQTTVETDAFGSMAVTLDAKGDATSLTDSLGKTITSGYDDNGNLTTFVQDGATSTIDYDPQGRETGADYGNGVSISYGHESQLDWNTVSSPTVGSLKRDFDDNGRLAGWETADGSNPEFRYDEVGRLKREINAQGEETEYIYDDQNRKTTVKNIRTGGEDIRENDAVGRLKKHTNAEGEITEYTYYPDGQIETVTKTLPNEEAATWTYTYTANSASAVDPLDRTSTTIFSPFGLPIETTTCCAGSVKTTYLAGLVSPEQEAEEYPATITDQSGRVRTFTYTESGQIKTATDLGGNTYTFKYDTDPGETAEDNGYLLAVEGPALTIPGATTPLAPEILVSYGYDDQDRQNATSYAGAGTVTQVYFESEDSVNAETHPEETGWLIPNGAKHLPVAQLHEANGKRHKVTFRYDAAGRERERKHYTSPTVSGSWTPEKEVATAYSPDGQLVSTQLTQNGQTRTTTYDSDYVNSRRVKTITHSTGSALIYEFDRLERIHKIKSKASATGAVYTTEYVYDLAGNLWKVKLPDQTEIVYEHDKLGRVKKRTLPNGVVTTYDYRIDPNATGNDPGNDPDNFVRHIVHKKVDGTTETVISAFHYVRSGLGEPTKITREDNSYVELDYDESHRLEEERYFDSSDALQEKITYVYDEAGNRRVLTRTVGIGSPQEFVSSYAPGYQLDAVTGPQNEDYEFDDFGRMIGIERGLDDLTLSYDTSDRVMFVTKNSQTTTYEYDAEGRRVKAVQGTTERRFVTGPTLDAGLDSPHLVSDGSGNVLAGYVHVGHRPLVRFEVDGSGNMDEPVFYLEDAMGSVINLANQSGTSLAAFQYDGFGNQRGTTGHDAQVASGVDGDFRFHGQWLEAGSGLYHVRAREYDSVTGKFLTRDPDEPGSENVEAFNSYHFANNNPYTYGDPTGEFTVIEMNIAQAIQYTLQILRVVGTAEVKSRAINTFAEAAFKQMHILFPGFDIDKITDHLAKDSLKTGNTIDKPFNMAACAVFNSQGVGDKFHYRMRMSEKGDIVGAGRNCTGRNPRLNARGPRRGYLSPDFIIGDGLVGPNGTHHRTHIVGEVKASTQTLYNAYVKGHQGKQLDAILNYATRHTDLHIAAFIVGKHNLKGLRAPQHYVLKRYLGFKAIRKGVFPVIVYFRK
ncbi:MAG: immunoglobulin domain-containing protein, partial [Verrucomicrobia bacterium]|nr:immunoglobulin domain-containing protein [Verrucomicrobiota bacterium]